MILRRLFRTAVAPFALLLVFTSLVFVKSQAKSKVEPTMIQKTPFGKLADGQSVDLYTLNNAHGMTVEITNYGATVVAIKVPDRQGKIDDVALGYDSVEGYVAGKAYIGATVGRYANRIGHGQFVLDGKTYTLPKNNGENTLHGGTVGFSMKMWQAREIPSGHGQSIEFSLISPDGDQGFPGTMHTTVTFTLPRDRNGLVIEYHATTDKNTVLNLTNHTYFDLSGEGNGNILQDQLKLYASHFTPIDATLIPTGEIRATKGTPLDFSQATAIGARIDADDPEIKFGKGYDHGYVLDRTKPGLMLAAEVFDPHSGRVLDVLTTQPGIQLYTSNFLDGSEKGKGGKPYNYRSAFCLETQHYADSPNKPNFPSTELKPGETFSSTTEYRFSVR
jgi:aldose 1-epimerase